MMFMWGLMRGALLALLLALPQAALAQAAPDSVQTSDATWERLATRAEELAQLENISVFAISRLRAELVIWRDVFLQQSDANAARLTTVDAQIAALGPAPEGDEPAQIAARRAALDAQRAALLAPRLLAQESYARANGLIGELDNRIVQRQTAALFERGPSPLDPALLGGAATALWSLAGALAVELRAGSDALAASGVLGRNLLRAAAYLAAAAALFTYAGGLFARLRHWLGLRSGRLLPLWFLLVSLLQLAVLSLGLLIVASGLEASGLLGLRGGAMVAALPSAGFSVIFAWWLGRQVFGVGSLPLYLGYDAATRAAAWRYCFALGGVLGLGAILDAGLQNLDLSAGVRAATQWPVLVVLGFGLWRLGRLIKTPPADPAQTPRLRALVGRLCTLAAVLGPVLALLGYGAAGRALLIPVILSLALVGVILVLQRIIHDLAGPQDDDSGMAKGLAALLPVLISGTLYLVSLPIFALIWGARTDDLREILTRFREGFAIGESRISPTDFLTFVVIFALGYLLTRFIQGTLRKTVLPRTRLDLGGQNAVVAGFGYVGIMLAAIIAITSAGIDLSNLAIVAGALSVGIGFGLQNIVSNFVSGIILLIERPVSEGDWIEVGGQMGYVRSISVRSTRIETFDRSDVIIPNADLVSGQVTNWTRGNLVGRVIVPVGVAYGTDTQKVTQILRDIAMAHPLVITSPPPAVLFIGFGADSLDFEIRAILRDVNFVMSAKSEMNHAIARAFAAEGIEIPFAQRDVWLRNPEALKDAGA